MNDSVQSTHSSPSPLPTLVLGLFGSISNVVLAASICEHDAHLGDPRPGTMARAKAVVCQVAESLACHGPPLHVGHLLYGFLQVFLVVVTAQRELLQQKKPQNKSVTHGTELKFKMLHAEPHLFDRAGVLDQSDVGLAVRDIQFVNDLVDPLLDQLKVLRTDAFGAVDQEHHVCRRVAASW